MKSLTFQVLEGMERGRVLENLFPPITIGREEDNGIQLNDERVSRFHAKVQEDGGRIILTDLESTNGTRVNGHPVQMHVLRIGDQVSIGRCLLLYGSAVEIEERIKARRPADLKANGNATVESGSDFDFLDAASRDDDEELPRLFPDGAPEIPDELRPVQVAQLADLLAHIHDRLRSVVTAGRVASEGGEMPPYELDWVAWQRALQLEMNVAEYLRSLTNPAADAD
ncbi:MAG: FHA domain-containing protein [Planctomycetota bacterium]|nr:FHA domain-containing protein [Planctomycetota bacterium]MDA1247853.1 FHA domain-containing protein [Planctomycetota bacterium]